MKQSNSFTFDLLKSLNPSEKAYVKKQINSTNNKHLVQLFDDLNKCDHYLKETFIKKHKTKSYIKNLSQNKNYLRKKIVESLISYRSKSVYEIEIHSQINEALILVEKNFYAQAKKIIDDCFKKSVKVEDFATCYILIGIIFKAINNKINFNLSKDEINEYRSERNFSLTQLNRMNTFSKLNNIYYNTSESEQLQAYQANFKKLNVLNEDMLPIEYPFAAKRIFYFSKSHVAWLSKNLDQYFNFNRKIFELYTSNEIYVQLYFNQFVGDSVNFLISLKRINNFEAFFQVHKKVMNMIELHRESSSSINESLVFAVQFTFLQSAYNGAKFFEKSLQFSNEHLSFLENNKANLSNHFKAVSTIEIALTYLYNQLYVETLEFIELVFKLKDYYSQYYSRIIQIITHHQLKNDLLLEHLFQSFYNYLKSANKKEQIPNIRKLRKHIKNKTVHLLKNEDFEEFVYIHWDVFKN